MGLEKRMANICNLMLEKKELAKRDAELSERKCGTQMCTMLCTLLGTWFKGVLGAYKL